MQTGNQIKSVAVRDQRGRQMLRWVSDARKRPGINLSFHPVSPDLNHSPFKRDSIE